MQEFDKINPRNGMCVIEPYKASNVSASGIVTSNDSNTTGGRVRGVILETAPEVIGLMVGDTVLFRRYSHDELKYVGPNGETAVYLVPDEEILAVPTLKQKAA